MLGHTSTMLASARKGTLSLSLTRNYMTTMFASFLPRRLRTFGIVAVCALTAGAVGAQSPKARIMSEITSSELVPIKGSLHPMAQAQNEAGRMPADTRMNGVTLYFNRSAAQQADLEALLTAQQNPTSPYYHQ